MLKRHPRISYEKSNEMKGATAKYLAIICILLVAKCIDSQKRTLSSVGTDTTTVTSITEAAVEGSPTKGAENPLDGTSNEQNGDVVNEVGDKQCVCDCNTGHLVTEGQIENSGDDEIKETSEKPLQENVNEDTVTPPNLVETQTEAINNGNPDITTTSAGVVSNEVTEGSTNSVEPSVETVTEANTAPLPPCTAVGDFQNKVNCYAYFTCAAVGGSLERIEKLCPSKSAFNVELGRCTRDISSCDDGVICSLAGTFADLNSNASYYWCVPRLLGGFRKYHIDCEAGKVFVPQLGKCFIDFNNLQNLPVNYGMVNSDEADDEDIVKVELKQFKAAEKLKLKEQKLKDKLEKKLQKQLAKKAAKEAKEQAKAKDDLKIVD